MLLVEVKNLNPDKDPFLQKNLENRNLEFKDKVQEILTSRADLVDYLRKNYRKNVVRIGCKDLKDLLARGNYKVLRDQYFQIPKKDCGRFLKRLKLLNEEKEEELKETLYVQKGLVRSSAADVAQFLETEGWIYKSSYPGDYLYGPRYNCLKMVLNQVYKDQILDSQCGLYSFCQMIPLQDLVKITHNRTMLGQYNFQLTLENVEDLKIKSTLEQFLDPVELKDRSKGCHYVYNFCACNGFFPAFRNFNIASKLSKFYDQSVLTYRNEKAKIHSLERLQVFTRSELVFLGEEIEVKAYVDELLERFKGFFEVLKVPVAFVKTNSWITGNLVTKDTYSIDFNFDLGSKELELGNINYNGIHWPKAYNIKVFSQVGSSGCSGLGHGRLIYAFLVANGTDSKDWPEVVKTPYEIMVSRWVKTVKEDPCPTT